ncbi:MAG: HEAT repeat domain-containing protein, partial [Anaerolineae bacterium]
MTGTTSFWWQALKKASDLIVNASEDVVGAKLKDQIEDKLKPVTKLLQDPESRKAFDRAFAQAAQAFEREASTDDERQLRQEVVALLGHTTRKEVRDADRDVIQRYVLASEPNRAPLDRWVRRQLSGQKFVVGQRAYTQEEVTRTLDAFFRQLNRAFWDQPLFRDQVNQADTTELLRQILDALRDQADITTLREDYLDYLRRHLAYLDLGGIAPKVANRTVKLPMRDIFVPVEAWRELDVGSAWPQARDLLAYGKGESWRLVPLTAPSKDKLKALLADLDGEQDVAWHAFQERAGRAGRIREVASVQDILATPRAVLLGHPGTGKSTTLKYVSYAIAAGLGDLVGEAALERLPILVRLVNYAQALGADPTLRLRDYVRDLHDKDRAPLFRQGLEEGACLVMLDGLDEVIDPRQRAAIADQVEALVADYPGNHYLLASRVVGYEAGRLTGDFTHFTLGPLPEASMRGFVRKWYEAIEREGGVEDSAEARARADELCQAIEERPGIRRLAENPLLLTIVALVNWRGRKLPNRRVEVYRHATETLIESWPRVRRGVAFDAEEVLGLLEPVAYRIFCDRSSEELAESDLLPLLADAVAETRPGMSAAGARDYVAGLLPSLSEHSGLFLERGFDAQSGERVFGFLHLTFAEYLTARYLAGQWEAEKDDEKRRAFLARYAHVPRWREVVLLMAQHVGLDGRRVRATQMLADILQLDSPYEEYLHRDLLLAGECLADDLRVEPAALEWVLDRLVGLMMETIVEPLRERIINLGRQMAGTTCEGALATRLLVWLEDEREQIGHHVIRTLGTINSAQAVGVLLGRLGDKSDEVRANAVWALGELKSERAVEALLDRLEDKSDE